jgi:hypothetical protein
MSAQTGWFRLTVLAAVFTAGWMATCRAEQPVPKLDYEAIQIFAQHSAEFYGMRN